MSEARHTPGPWEATQDKKGRSIVTAGNGIICRIDEWAPHIDRADARLIAAAPDMLEALRKAEGWLAEWASAEPYIGEIRAVIAKAEGR